MLQLECVAEKSAELSDDKMLQLVGSARIVVDQTTRSDRKAPRDDAVYSDPTLIPTSTLAAN